MVSLANFALSAHTTNCLELGSSGSPAERRGKSIHLHLSPELPPRPAFTRPTPVHTIVTARADITSAAARMQ